MKRRIGARLAPLALLLGARAVLAYPLDGAAATGITRLEAYRLATAGKVAAIKLPPGALATSADMKLRLAETADFALPEPDPKWNAKLGSLLGDEADRYSVAILDLTDPGHPLYGEHRATSAQNPGSVGKLLVALALFQKLADLYPDDIEARRRVLRDSQVTADSFIQSDHHTVPFWTPGDSKVVKRRLAEGDAANLWTYLDWMCSSSSNAAASMVMKQLVLLAHFGTEYPVPAERARSFLGETPKKQLQEIFLEAITAPVARNGLDLEQLRQGSFFTRAGKNAIPGTSSHATVRELMRYVVKMEQGRLVDAFSSMEIKKLLYMTDRRIRYASSPALSDAAVYFKSGSWFGCKPEPGFVCRQYQGNVRNLMNSVAIVEMPQRRPALDYIVVVMSNVLRKNSAVAHQTLATRIHRWMEAVHPPDPGGSERPINPTDPTDPPDH
jgi:hypothetical protein